jgi:hypothetical protein
MSPQPPSQPPLHLFATPHLLPCAPVAPTFASPSPPGGTTQLPPPAACMPAPAHTGAQPQLQAHPHSHSQPHEHEHEHPRSREHEIPLDSPHPCNALDAADATSHPTDHIARHPHMQPPSTTAQPHLQPPHIAVHNASPISMAILVHHAHRAPHGQLDGLEIDRAHAHDHASAASSSSTGVGFVPPSFGDHRNRDEQIWSTVRVTPNLLACARLLSGRALLTDGDLARFMRPTFDPCAFLREHVCDSSQTAICFTPREITPALATLIHSALILTTDGCVAALTRRPPHADPRPCMVCAHIPLTSACPTAIHQPHARPARSDQTASLAPWPARSSPPSALLPPQRLRSCTFAPPPHRQRPTPLPPLRGRGGLAYPVRVFFNTPPGCRVRLPDERCRPIWTNRPPPSGEDRCVYPVGTVSSVSWRVAHTPREAILKLAICVKASNTGRDADPVCC